MPLQNRILLSLALFSLVLLVACGSSSSSAVPNNNGFSNGNLTGTYVFSSSGSDSTNGYLLDIAGAFTANGSGGITAGTIDVIDPEYSPTVSSGVPVTSGSYTVSTDGRGLVTLNVSGASFTFAFALSTTSNGVSSHGTISEFDDNGSGSGTLDLQTSLTGLSQLANPYAFNVSGWINDTPAASTGSVTFNSGGAITAGIQDVNVNASTVLSGLTVTGGGATLGSGTGPGTIIIDTSDFSATFDFYPVDSTHLKMIETDGNNFLAGDAFVQTGAAIPSGAMVFTMAGGTVGPIAMGGLMTGDGQGDFSNGLEDYNDNGTLSSSQISFTGTAAGPASTGGRVLVNLDGFVPASSWVIYPTASAGLLMLEMDNDNVTQGVGYAQTATSFSTGSSGSNVGYGMNLSGFNLDEGIEVDDIAQFNATSGTSNNMSGVFEENVSGVRQLGPANFTGTYTPDSPATGRGSISMPLLPSLLGELSLEYYVVDGSTILLIEGDTEQVSAGVFELQGSAGSGVAKNVASHHAMFTVHTFGRSRASKLRK